MKFMSQFAIAYIDAIESEILYAATKGEVVWRAGERESPEGIFVALQ
ncbi:MAG: hypothetical protein NTV52_07700 [Acidobacteria bacterium]|nr:hypothetical protein [Acidobacteriota bacterium]